MNGRNWHVNYSVSCYDLGMVPQLSGQASFHICSEVEREFSPSCGLILSADFAHKNVAAYKTQRF